MPHFRPTGILLLILLLPLAVACEWVEVDPAETDLMTPYIPVFSPDGTRREAPPVVPDPAAPSELSGAPFLERMAGLVEENRCPEAIPALRKHLARGESPQYAQVIYYLARCYQRTGRLAEAVALLEAHADRFTYDTPLALETVGLMIELKKALRSSAGHSEEEP